MAVRANSRRGILKPSPPCAKPHPVHGATRPAVYTCAWHSTPAGTRAPGIHYDVSCPPFSRPRKGRGFLPHLAHVSQASSGVGDPLAVAGGLHLDAASLARARVGEPVDDGLSLRLHNGWGHDWWDSSKECAAWTSQTLARAAKQVGHNQAWYSGLGSSTGKQSTPTHSPLQTSMGVQW